jgi:hypothetical protein
VKTNATKAEKLQTCRWFWFSQQNGQLELRGKSCQFLKKLLPPKGELFPVTLFNNSSTLSKADLYAVGISLQMLKSATAM